MKLYLNGVLVLVLAYSFSFPGGSSNATPENAGETTAGSRTFSILSIGTGWQLSPTLSMIMRVGIGLTNDDPDFIFSLRMPFQFELGG